MKAIEIAKTTENTDEVKVVEGTGNFENIMKTDEIVRGVLDKVLWTANASEDNKQILTNALVAALSKNQDSVLDKMMSEIEHESFSEEIFDEDVFNSTYSENCSAETAECESYIETDIVKLRDIYTVVDKYKNDK